MALVAALKPATPLVATPVAAATRAVTAATAPVVLVLAAQARVVPAEQRLLATALVATLVTAATVATAGDAQSGNTSGGDGGDAEADGYAEGIDPEAIAIWWRWWFRNERRCNSW